MRSVQIEIKTQIENGASLVWNIANSFCGGKPVQKDFLTQLTQMDPNLWFFFEELKTENPFSPLKFHSKKNTEGETLLFVDCFGLLGSFGLLGEEL